MKGIYLVTDTGACKGKSLESVVSDAIRGGVAVVQLREKKADTRDFLEKALALKAILKPAGVPLIINDRLDIALAAGADGVHLGQSDMPYAHARRFLGSKAIIGLSVETWEDVEEAQKLDVDYLGVSPVFPTPTKTDTKEPWGLEGLQKIKKFSRHPLVAIGGINESNSLDLIRAGADCLAVVSAICSADDPFLATRQLLGQLRITN
jgi:thiamine-phosphate pyrophosphorylase